MGLSMVKGRAAVLAVLLYSVSAQSCVSVSHMEKKGMRASDTSTAGKFAGTQWRLVEIQSMDDAIGTARPSNRDFYTMDLNADGTAAMRLNCNRGRDSGPRNRSGMAEKAAFASAPRNDARPVFAAIA
jgi:hypothetical protein